MDLALFRESPSGKLVPSSLSGIGPVSAFVPDPLPPRNLRLEPIMNLLAQASIRLGELNGVGSQLQNPFLLIRPLQRREAVASSTIEGTIASLEDVLLFEAGAADRERSEDTREVHNYVRALETSIAQLEKIPLSLRIILGAHAQLMTGVTRYRGSTPPGELRREQNAIVGNSMTDPRFVPPPPAEVAATFGALENYMNERPDAGLPTLVKAALIHYQFETIHPFPDGNGRVGRMLIPLHLMAQGVLAQPLLYLSPYFERNRATYIDRLFKVSCSGAWLDWVSFFLQGIVEESADAIKRIKRLQAIRADFHTRLGKTRGNLIFRIVDIIAERSYIVTSTAAEELGVTYAAVQKNIEKLIEKGILERVPVLRHPRVFVSKEIRDAVQGRT